MIVKATFIDRLRNCISGLAAVSLVMMTTPVWACDENGMIVFDASGSMAVMRDGERKIDTARSAAGEVLDDLTRRRPTGLVTYGGVPGQTCGGISLKIPPVLDSGGMIASELSMLEPSGQTPLSEAVFLAAQTLQQNRKPGVIVLVTDGLENCGYDACALGNKLKAMVPRVRVHVIGFHLNSVSEHRVACLAKATEGTYTAARSLEALQDALKKTLSCQRIS